MKKARFVFLAVFPGLMAACTTTRNVAPVVDRTPSVRPVEMPRTPPVTAAPPKHVDNRGYYTVRKGDTLIQIALEFGQNYRDLVAWNNLANPNDIKVEQVLRVSPPEAGSVAPGAPQTGSVNAGTGVEVKPLSPSASASAGAAVASNKTGPRGDKRPYSDAALAELQKPETAGAASQSSPAVASRTEPAKPVDKLPEIVPPAATDDDSVSWIWPADGKVVGTFSDGKKGIDIAGKIGQPVLAAGSGKVLYAGSGIRGYGNLVIVKHSNNLLSAYAHNKTIFVKEDQTVTKGQKIAEMGNSDSDAVKLHFEIRQQGKPVDPSKFLPSR
jgi:lipoprotein NlpD